MKIIAVFGRKGGSGKTMVSHFVSHGLALLNQQVVMLQTDVRETRPPEILDTRAYYLASTRGDGNDAQKIMDVVEKTAKIPGAVLVIDGGANRRNIDIVFSKIANLVLIPTGYGSEDIDVAEADYRELTRVIQEKKDREIEGEAYIVMNKWPGSQKQMQRVHQKRYIQDFMARAKYNQNLFPYFVPDMPTMVDLAHGNDPTTTLLIDSKAKAFAGLIARKLELIDDEPEVGGEVHALPSAQFNDGGQNGYGMTEDGELEDVPEFHRKTA